MSVNVVWLKRDLRLADHHPLWIGLNSGKPLILLYVVEDILVNDPHYSLRHWRFIYQSLQDIAAQLPPSSLWIRCGEALTVLQNIHRDYQIESLLSHVEVGLLNTFQRDMAVAAWCKQVGICWQESRLGAVQRGLKHRRRWDKDWQAIMRQPLWDVDLTGIDFIKDRELVDLPDNWRQIDVNFQQGGESAALTVLQDFYLERGRQYRRGISSPLLSRVHCSRLSPYLAWGNISLRQAYQSLLSHWHKPGWRRSLMALSSRLHWHCHFMQKFESEHQMQHRHINGGYQSFPYLDGEVAERHYQLWQAGETGYPLVDAVMKCLQATGYINFRMRAMLISFLSHHLLLDWRKGVQHLAQLFLDFEPGIHYSQCQMQAGVTGINTLRIYNPVKQSKEQDPDGKFILQWLPALAVLPIDLVHEPWLVTPLEQQMYQFELGQDYPAPVVDIVEAGRVARDQLWRWRKRPQVQREAARILARHVRP